MKLRLIPALLPPTLLVLLCISVFIEEMNSPVRYINGAPDNAPMRAAGIGVILSPFLFAACLLFQVLLVKFVGIIRKRLMISYLVTYFLLLVYATIGGIESITAMAALAGCILIPMAAASFFLSPKAVIPT